MAPAVLETIDLTHSFGKVVVANEIDVEIYSGELVGIVGPNGAGKTSFLNLVTGYIEPAQGKILYQGQNITEKDPREITNLGIARSFQIAQLFTTMTVLENMLVALSASEQQAMQFWRPLKQEARVEHSRAILAQFGLEDYGPRPVVELPEGGRKLLDIAMSYALDPTLLLMDEPTSGISTEDKFEVMDVLVSVLRESGVTTIFVEHDIEVVSRYADRVLVFAGGQIAADGPPAELLGTDEVRRAMGWEV